MSSGEVHEPVVVTDKRRIDPETGAVRAGVPGPAPSGPAPGPSPAESEEAAELKSTLQRVKAEYDNYRKRSARQEQAAAERGKAFAATQLLPVLDDLERALDAASAHEEGKLEEGVRLVHRSLADALAKEGLSEIETSGRFDPHTQEALLSQPSEAEEGSIIQVLQKGYSLGDRVLRPARVVISSGPGADG